MTIRQDLKSAGFGVKNVIDLVGTPAVGISFRDVAGIVPEDQYERMYAIIGPNDSGQAAQGFEFNADGIYIALFPRERLDKPIS